MRPVHIWWIGVAVFAPSLVLSGLLLYVSFRTGPPPQFDWYMTRKCYLPLSAAILGFSIPLVCLRRLRHASGRLCGWSFAAYVAVMLTWGVIDVRCVNYQIGGHEYPNGVLVDGHKYYFHTYITWYFLPYRWIEPDTESKLHREFERVSAVAKDLMDERAAQGSSEPAAADTHK